MLYNDVSPERANKFLNSQTLGYTEFFAGEAVGAGAAVGIYKAFRWLKNVKWLNRIFKSAESIGFKSFSAFKRAMGSAGKGRHWHHIVEANRAGRFGAEAVHNAKNVVLLPSKIHNKISGYYSSKIPGLTGGKTVRQWLSSKSFEFQYKFGQKIIKNFGGM
jgi:hypothetical protein